MPSTSYMTANATQNTGTGPKIGLDRRVAL
jgi:hypothetical protein